MAEVLDGCVTCPLYGGKFREEPSVINATCPLGAVNIVYRQVPHELPERLMSPSPEQLASFRQTLSAVFDAHLNKNPESTAHPAYIPVAISVLRATNFVLQELVGEVTNCAIKVGKDTDGVLTLDEVSTVYPDAIAKIVLEAISLGLAYYAEGVVSQE